MTKFIAAAALAFAVVGCTATTLAPIGRQNEKQKRAKAQPNLDRTYDFGSRPPVPDPDREKD